MGRPWQPSLPAGACRWARTVPPRLPAAAPPPGAAPPQCAAAAVRRPRPAAGAGSTCRLQLFIGRMRVHVAMRKTQLVPPAAYKSDRAQPQKQPAQSQPAYPGVVATLARPARQSSAATACTAARKGRYWPAKRARNCLQAAEQAACTLRGPAGGGVLSGACATRRQLGSRPE